jgi:hypothetical protein
MTYLPILQHIQHGVQAGQSLLTGHVPAPDSARLGGQKLRLVEHDPQQDAGVP